MEFNQLAKGGHGVKKILLAVTCFLGISTANAGGFLLAVGTGQEEIIAPRKFTVDLYQVVGSYKFDSMVYTGASVQKGYPTTSTISDETRTEGFVGYAPKFGNFMPYGQAAVGYRDFSNSAIGDYKYWAVTAGSKYNFTDRIYGDVRYRYRNNFDSPKQWKSNLYGGGLGYKITPAVDIEAGYAYTNGDYESKQWGVFLINKF